MNLYATYEYFNGFTVRVYRDKNNRWLCQLFDSDKEMALEEAYSKHHQYSDVESLFDILAIDHFSTLLSKRSKPRGKTAIYKCKTCKDPFEARIADRNRGWARYCSKSCKAIKQARRIGHRHSHSFNDAHLFSNEGCD